METGSKYACFTVHYEASQITTSLSGKLWPGTGQRCRKQLLDILSSSTSRRLMTRVRGVLFVNSRQERFKKSGSKDRSVHTNCVCMQGTGVKSRGRRCHSVETLCVLEILSWVRRLFSTVSGSYLGNDSSTFASMIALTDRRGYLQAFYVSLYMAMNFRLVMATLYQYRR